MGEVSSLGKPPGWSHRIQMKQYMRALAPKVKATGAFDRELHKEVARQNAANKVTESVVQQIIHDPLPIVSVEDIDGAVVHASSSHGSETFTAAESKLLGSQRREVTPLNEIKPMSTNRTGLASVVGSLLSDLESAKQESLAAGETLSSAITEAKEAASEVRKVARDIQREAAEAMSALGQISNGAPD